VAVSSFDGIPADRKITTMKMFIITVLFTSSLLTFGGELADYHSTHPINSKGSRSPKEIASANHGITEIGIERTTCFGECPAYTFIVKSDGSFRYKGDQYVGRTGEFKGTITVWRFDQLARFIRDSGYMDLGDLHWRLVSDHPTVYTTVVLGGKRKVVSNYVDAGPTKLWAIEQLIDDLMREAQWTESENAADKKK
jgi:Domain of unknown function (DUF6438)